jgi:hypothetical protein
VNASAPQFTRRTRAGLFAFLIALMCMLVALSLSAPAPARAAGTIIYVNAATGDDLADGTSWASAAHLQDALTSGGNVTATSGDQRDGQRKHAVHPDRADEHTGSRYHPLPPAHRAVGVKAGRTKRGDGRGPAAPSAAAPANGWQRAV